jgi:carboxylesterase type B
MLAYGGSKPLPYQQGICQSQALEPGIVHTIIGAPSVTQEAFRKVVVHTGCGSNNQTLDDMDKPEVIDCLRLKETQSLLDAAISTYSSDIAHNIGDIWLPSVDGDFLPDAPSKLLAQGRFGNATYMFGWAQDDVNFFTNTSIADEGDVTQFVRNYLPGLGTALVSLENGLISRYNAEEFSPRAGSNLTSSFYRTARIFRDILMVCEPLLMAEALNRNGNKVFLYNWNQTILDPILESVYNVSGMGVVHTSEFAYIYGNLSAYNVSGYPFNPTQQDYDLMHRASRTWSTFATKGFVGEKENGLAGWSHAFWGGDDFLTPPNPGYPYVYTIGGPMEGLFSIDGPESPGIVEKQKLVERCGFLNTPSIIRQIGF